MKNVNDCFSRDTMVDFYPAGIYIGAFDVCAWEERIWMPVVGLVSVTYCHKYFNYWIGSQIDQISESYLYDCFNQL